MPKAKNMSIEMIALSAIVPNPYRHFEKYQLSEDKINGLIASYANSGFWDGSIQARPHPKKEGKYEIAFVHHRIEAARRAGIEQVGLVLAKRTNSDMLRMMADENREEFRSDARVTMETIAAVIEAYGREEIELEPVDSKTPRSQIYVLPAGKTYTLGTVARFLGWIKPSDGQATAACRAAFEAYLERDSTGPALDTIPASQRSEIAVKTVPASAHAARRAGERAGLLPAQIKQAERDAALAAAAEVRDKTGFKARKEAKEIGRAGAAEGARPKAKVGPDVEVYIRRLCEKCDESAAYQTIVIECRRLIPFHDDLDPDQLHKLADSIERMIERDRKSV